MTRDPHAPSSLHWLMLALVLAIALALLGVCLREPRPRVGAPSATGGERFAIVQPTLSRVDRGARRLPDLAVEVADPPAAAGTDEVEVCGFGTVGLAVDDPYALQNTSNGLRAALVEAEATMLASPDERVRAAALVLEARSRGDDGAGIDRLARLAAASQDPLVYAAALDACSAQAGVGAAHCALLSAAQWARLDPDNAQPWLALAEHARQRQDAGAEGEAMFRAAHAHGSDTRAGLLPTLVERAIDARAPPLLRTLALWASWSVQPALEQSHARQAYAYCSPGALADSNRRATCESLAEALSFRSTSLTDLGIGLAIARNVGWPVERLRALEQEQEAISEASGPVDYGVDLSCRAIDRVQGWMRRLGARGELQALRDVIAQSGRSVEEWSAQHRRSYAVAEAAARAAASAQ